MFARDNILFRHPPLAEIDVALVSLDADDHDGLYAADLDEAVEAPYTASRELRQRDHALGVVVLEEGDVGAKVADGLDLDHHRRVHVRVLGFVHSALEVGRHGLIVTGCTASASVCT